MVERIRTIPIMSQADIYAARMTTRQAAIEIGMSLIDQARISLAASSLASCLKMGGNHSVPDQIFIHNIEKDTINGLELMFVIRHPYQMENLEKELIKISELVDSHQVEHLENNTLRVTLTKWVQLAKPLQS